MKLFWLLPALVAVVYSQYVERECACTLSNLWVDVVVAIDNSKGMGADGMAQVLGNIESVFGQSKLSQSGGQSSRLGVVTYNSDAATEFALTYFTSTDQMIEELWNINMTTVSTTSTVKKGLQAAANLLEDGRPEHKWDNVRQAIIVYASDYNGRGEDDPVPLAEELRSSGIDIITVSFNQEGDNKVLQGLKDIATPGMAFTNMDADVVGEVQQALCQVNCYCPNKWRQFADNFDAPQKRYGLCMKFGDLDSIWIAAQHACQSMYNDAYLATEFSMQKHTFNAAMAKADGTQSDPFAYHIGLRYNNATSWAWEQPKGQPTLPLYASTNATAYTTWNAGYPSQTYQTTTCVLNSQTSTLFKLGWQDESCTSVSKRYLCQVSSCDTDQYCA